MIDERELLEEELERFTPAPGLVERVERRRERKLRRQRLAAGALGLVIAVAMAGAAVIALRDPGPVASDETSAPPPTVETSTPTPSVAPELPQPLVELAPGYFVVDIGTGEAIRLPESIRTVEGAGNFDVSPDGSMILFDNASRTTASDESVRLGFHQLYIANIDGTDVHQLTNDPVGASQGSWSPDGTKVVYLGGWAKLCCFNQPADLSVLDVATGTTDVLAHGAAKDFLHPYFSADVSEIHFTRYRNFRHFDLWTIPAGGGQPQLLVEDRGDAWFGGQSSPDGTSIIYPRWEDSSDGNCMFSYPILWISNMNGSDPRPLSPKAATDGRPMPFVAGWSPDGSSLAFAESVVPLEPCSNMKQAVFVMDTETGDRMLLAYGYPIDWVDDETLIVRAR